MARAAAPPAQGPKHVRNKITECLADFEEVGIYEVTPFITKYKDMKETGYDRAVIVEGELFRDYYEGEDPRWKAQYLEFYDICYEMIETANAINTGEYCEEENKEE